MLVHHYFSKQLSFLFPKNSEHTLRKTQFVVADRNRILIMIHFLFTTVAMNLLNDIQTMSPYFDRIVNHQLPNNFHLAMFQNALDHDQLNMKQQFISWDDVDLVCAKLSKEVDHKVDSVGGGAEVETKRLLNDYIHFRLSNKTPRGWVADTSQQSCVLHDQKHDMLFLIGDTIGSLPLWYEFKTFENGLSRGVFVSTHALLSTTLEFTRLSPVGAGITMSFDLSSNSIELMRCQHWSEGKQSYESIPMKEIELISAELLRSTTASVRDLLTKRKTDEMTSENALMTELDMHDDSSVLLECAIHGATDIDSKALRAGVVPAHRLRYNTQPLISDHHGTLPSVLTQELLGNNKVYSCSLTSHSHSLVLFLFLINQPHYPSVSTITFLFLIAMQRKFKTFTSMDSRKTRWLGKQGEEKLCGNELAIGCLPPYVSAILIHHFSRSFCQC